MTNHSAEGATGTVAVAAVASAKPRTYRMTSVATGDDISDSRKQASSLRKTAINLLQIADEIDGRLRIDDHPVRTGEGQDLPAATRELMRNWVRREMVKRRARTELFNSDYFREPAWEILLTLFVARLEGRYMQTTKVCLASTASHTTALRWISQLEEDGMIIRVPHRDARISLLALSDQGFGRVSRYVALMVE